MSTCCPSSSQHYASDLAHLLDANGLLLPYTAPALSDNNTSLGHDYELPHELIPEGWRAGYAHLSRGSTGIWHMRLRVPAALRKALRT